MSRTTGHIYRVENREGKLSLGDRIIDAVIRSNAIERAEITGDDCLFIWNANAAEQLEAAFAENENKTYEDGMPEEG